VIKPEKENAEEAGLRSCSSYRVLDTSFFQITGKELATRPSGALPRDFLSCVAAFSNWTSFTWRSDYRTFEARQMDFDGTLIRLKPENIHTHDE